MYNAFRWTHRAAPVRWRGCVYRRWSRGCAVWNCLGRRHFQTRGEVLFRGSKTKVFGVEIKERSQQDRGRLLPNLPAAPQCCSSTHPTENLNRKPLTVTNWYLESAIKLNHIQNQLKKIIDVKCLYIVDWVNSIQMWTKVINHWHCQSSSHYIISSHF